jgi:hypothetical protein
MRALSGQQANLPPFVTLDVRQRRLFSGLFGGEGLFDPGDAYEDENVLILHGRHQLLTWTAVVAKNTGQMSMSITNLGRTYAEFGTCTPHPTYERRAIAHQNWRIQRLDGKESELRPRKKTHQRFAAYGHPRVWENDSR